MKSLDEIFIECQTDKSSQTHCYAKTYEKYFESLRDKEFTMLELGVSAGGSIRAWRQYFTKAKIYGVDNNQDCLMEGVFVGDATNKEFLDSVLSIIGKPSIVIDDSGHVGHETVQSFEILFPEVKSGGLYCIEDCATFYSSHYSGEFEGNGRSKVYNFFADLPYHVDVAGRGMCGNQDFCIEHPSTEPPIPKYSKLLKAIHTHTSLWIYERK